MILSNKIVQIDSKDRHHNQIRLCYDPGTVLQSDIDWLVSFLTQNIASGVKYEPEQLVQIGCVVLKVVQRENGILSFCEPDFRFLPINFVDSTSQTLIQLRMQKTIAEAYGFQEKVKFPSILESCLICNRVSDRIDFMMERFEPSKNDSGWYLGCLEKDHDHNDHVNLQRVSLYEIACQLPSCVPFLALPKECIVERKSHEFALRYAGKIVTPRVKLN